MASLISPASLAGVLPADQDVPGVAVVDARWHGKHRSSELHREIARVDREEG